MTTIEKPKQKRRKKAQPYDSTLKQWVQSQAPQVIPQLLSGASYLETMDVERIRPTLRTDRVHKVMYRGGPHIMHLEFESSEDENMASRLLVYHAILLQDYKLPVISIIIYPFKVAMAESPWHAMSGEEAMVTFNFRTLPFHSLDAEYYLKEHVTCMYPLLPTMHNVRREHIEAAMEELACLYCNDRGTLSQQFAWMNVLLEHRGTLSAKEKHEMKKSLSTYDYLWESHPKVKEIKAQARAEAQEAKAKAQAEAQAETARIKAELEQQAEERARQIEERAKQVEERAKQTEEHAKQFAEETMKMLRTAFVALVQARFPTLTEMAQTNVALVETPQALSLLFKQITVSCDENEARLFLRSIAA